MKMRMLFLVFALVLLSCNFLTVPFAPSPEPPPLAPTTPSGSKSDQTAEPVVSVEPPIQTMVSGTKGAYPVVGSVEWEGGRCCAGGDAGEVIEIAAQFSARSPHGEVTDLRIGTGGFCFSEEQLSSEAWEPFVPEKNFPVHVALNWIGHYISVQYQDEAGNLSPVFCDDISVEGHPPSSTPM